MSAEPFLAVEELSVRFGGLTAVDGLSLSADRGEVVGLIGPNGAGKTTSFNAVLGLLRPQSGRVCIGGVDATGLAPARRSRLGIGRTFQKPEVFGSMTVLENLLYATEAPAIGDRPWRLLTAGRHRDGALAEETLELCGLRASSDALAGDLPLGAARLVEFGRALCTRPQLLMLDEPSSGLDQAETATFGRVVLESVDRWGLGVLLIEHDMNLVRQTTTRLSVLESGRLIAEGPTGDVMRDRVVQRAYLGETNGAARAS
jgi:ABC-type branched-subunit amino acid transport system ATPase component